VCYDTSKAQAQTYSAWVHKTFFSLTSFLMFVRLSPHVIVSLLPAILSERPCTPQITRAYIFYTNFLPPPPFHYPHFAIVLAEYVIQRRRGVLLWITSCPLL
jgi:hypothetical protein